WKGWAILLRQKQKKLIMLPSETMIWQPEFTDKTLSRKPGAVQLGITTRSGRTNITVGCHQMNRKTDTGKTLKRWPVFVDHYKTLLRYSIFQCRMWHKRSGAWQISTMVIRALQMSCWKL
ncbi:hypothetical protein U9017_19905, partial [Escherichia coli]